MYYSIVTHSLLAPSCLMGRKYLSAKADPGERCSNNRIRISSRVPSPRHKQTLIQEVIWHYMLETSHTHGHLLTLHPTLLPTYSSDSKELVYSICETGTVMSTALTHLENALATTHTRTVTLRLAFSLAGKNVMSTDSNLRSFVAHLSYSCPFLVAVEQSVSFRIDF